MASELLHDFLEKEIKQPPAIIGRGILPVAGKILIVGGPKEGKSWFALHMAIDLSLGRNIFNAKYPSGKPVFPVFNRNRVLYIEKELGAKRTQDRLRQMTQGTDTSKMDFYVIPRRHDMRLDKDEFRKAFRGEIATIHPQVVFIDPFIEFHGYDENSAQEMGSVMRELGELQEEFSTSFVIVHHPAKFNPENPRRGINASRGSSVIPGSIDASIEFKRVSNSTVKEPLISLTFDVRNDEPIESMMMQRLKSGLYVFRHSIADHEATPAPEGPNLLDRRAMA